MILEVQPLAELKTEQDSVIQVTNHEQLRDFMEQDQVEQPVEVEDTDYDYDSD